MVAVVGDSFSAGGALFGGLCVYIMYIQGLYSEGREQENDVDVNSEMACETDRSMKSNA